MLRFPRGIVPLFQLQCRNLQRRSITTKSITNSSRSLGQRNLQQIRLPRRSFASLPAVTGQRTVAKGPHPLTPIANLFYQHLLRSNTTYVLLVLSVILVAEPVFEVFTTGLWNSMNPGKGYEETIPVRFGMPPDTGDDDEDDDDDDDDDDWDDDDD